ncbi:thioredoxin domain-containing protein [Humibacter soli]
MPNRLADAVSPYLLAHADNPVNWHPWSEDVFAEARERDVPVFVSIGYATCHWCHVMARESFSDPELAARLNEGFVPVKVDREEHPDVDAAFLTAASAFTRNLGWPLSVFTTPDGRAFFAGTYFPPQARGGLPSFEQVLDAVSDAWTHRRDQAADTASRVAAAVSAMRAEGGGGASIDPAALQKAAVGLAGVEDPEFGGFGTAPEFPGPKFPAVPALGFLLGSGTETGRDAARHTLRSMALSPLRDVDGGFFRYGTRRDWSEPHYERMLYDNAGLLRLYADAAVQRGRISEDARLFADTAEGIARFLLTTLRVDDGFASAQDSESEVDGVRREGAYYLLEPAARSAQPTPRLDEKVLTGWNGLAIGALAHAGALLGHEEWTTAAMQVADRLIASHVSVDGRMLVRASLGGRVSSAAPALEDFGLFARGLLDVFLATGEPRFAVAARTLVDATLDAAVGAGSDAPFAVPGGGDPVLAGLGLVSDADPSEGAYPSGSSALADSARVLYALTGDDGYDHAARTAIGAVAGLAPGNPLAFGAALQVAGALLGEPRQLVVVAGEQLPRSLAHAVALRGATDGETDDPVATVAVAVTEGAASALAEAGFELFEARTANGGEPTEYLCRSFVCELPRPFAIER